MDESRFRLDDFELYQVARQFRKKSYTLIKQVPPAEKYCLVSQMRRAATSVTNNIAEGHGRYHYKENIHFCRVSRGSVSELLDDFNICEDEGYGDQALVMDLQVDAYALIRRINGYIAYLRKCQQGGTE